MSNWGTQWYRDQAGSWQSARSLHSVPSGARSVSSWGDTPMGKAEAQRSRLMSEYQRAFDEAKAANLKRYDEGMGIYDQVASLYTPGGQYGQGAMASYERGKTRSRASAYQGLVNAGMANLTKGTGFDKSYEEEVGTPFRLNLNDMRTGAYGGALKDKAGFIERREDSYPDSSMYVALMNQLGQA